MTGSTWGTTVMLCTVFAVCALTSAIMTNAIMVAPAEQRGTTETETLASEMLREVYPHAIGFTFGVSCYAPPDWCHATVIHPMMNAMKLSVYCDNNKCKIEE